MNEYGKCITHSFLADFAELERRMVAHFLYKNKGAERLPARKRKSMYGKAKLPYTMIHDEIQINTPKGHEVGIIL